MKTQYEKDKTEYESYLNGSSSAFQKLQHEKSELQDQVNFMKEEMEVNQQEMKEELEMALSSTESAVRQLEKEKVELNIQLNTQNIKTLNAEKTALESRFENELKRMENEQQKVFEN